MLNKKSPKYIFVSGGVLSGLGKGVTAASLGFLLKNRGLKVTNIKCENYLNLDSGNINPVEHGDVFLCEDGTEADLDLGTYERFLGQEVGKKNYTTMGQIYQKVIDDAKNMKYNGATVEAIPHVPEEAIRRIENAARGFEVCLVELGGTAGEYQNIVYFEAYRIMKLKRPGDVIHVHVTYFPRPDHINELKSKPTQLSVKQLQSMGIQPDFIVGRSPVPIDKKRKEKVAYFCNMTAEAVISNPDLASIYQLPLVFSAQDFDKKALEKLNLRSGKADLGEWKKMVDEIERESAKTVTVGIVANYMQEGSCELQDTYASLLEALKHAAYFNKTKIQVKFISAEDLDKNLEKLDEMLSGIDGLMVPIGWGTHGMGRNGITNWIRKKQMPCLAIGFGENVLDTTVTNSRLGGYESVLKKDSRVAKIYAKYGALVDKEKMLISERHRQNHEFNDIWRGQLKEEGLVVAGEAKEGGYVEIIELEEKEHPFFVAIAAHPEYKSSPLKPHPLFAEFVRVVARK